ncbi:MAG: serine hydrolase [bacterium]|nr:serine hydrolase [bacterium]
MTHFLSRIPWYRLEAPSDYWPLFQGQAAKFQPGERFSYSNGGYVFLGLLVEKITGQLFAILCKNSSSRLPTCLGRAFSL